MIIGFKDSNRGLKKISEKFWPQKQASCSVIVTDFKKKKFFK